MYPLSFTLTSTDHSLRPFVQCKSDFESHKFTFNSFQFWGGSMVPRAHFELKFGYDTKKSYFTFDFTMIMDQWPLLNEYD